MSEKQTKKTRKSSKKPLDRETYEALMLDGGFNLPTNKPETQVISVEYEAEASVPN